MCFDYFVAFFLNWPYFKICKDIAFKFSRKIWFGDEQILKVRTVCWVGKNIKMSFFSCLYTVRKFRSVSFILFYMSLLVATDGIFCVCVADSTFYMSVWETALTDTGSRLHKTLERWLDEHSVTFSAGQPDQQIIWRSTDNSPKSLQLCSLLYLRWQNAVQLW